MKPAWLFLALVAIVAWGCAPTPGASSALPVMEAGVNPEAWAPVPAGEFLMGQHEHTTPIAYDYEAMVVPVTNAQYARYLQEALAQGSIKLAGDQVVGYYPGDEFHGHRHEKKIEAGDWLHLSLANPDLRLTWDGGTFAVRPGYENHPMTGVSWFGARAYCEFYGWRLPTEAEWEKAARGTDGRAFPWGDEIAPENANFYDSRDPFEKDAGALGDTTPVGFYNGKVYANFQTIDSPSPYGLYDMAGNVQEWTNDIYEGTHYRYLRGGSKADYGYDLRVWARNSAEPDYYSPNVGFRCVRSK